MGSLPHIYRRANFSHRATPTILPHTGSSSPHLSLQKQWSFVSRPTESLESPHIESVLRTHMGLPHTNREDRDGRYPWANWTRARQLVYPSIVGVSFWSHKETSSGHAGVPKERESRKTPRSPPPYIPFRQWPYSNAYPQSCDWERRGTSSVRFSLRFLQVTPPRTLHVLHGYSSTPQREVGLRRPNPSASDA